MSRSSQLLTVLLLCELLITVSASKYRTCEPYLDAAKMYHYGFYCPRLNEEQKHIYCCRQSDQTLKYCCNESEFQSTMKFNQTAPETGTFKYGSMIAVLLYGMCVVALLLTDLLHYRSPDRQNLWQHQPPWCFSGCGNDGDGNQTQAQP
ncbi:protein shisa-like-1a [Scyliorhinus torazame]|uniref:protein shisa-like-1a n=1 Tax=Scyliorhinus torazame TaxID=75743 RepID=UPI003B5CE082